MAESDTIKVELELPKDDVLVKNILAQQAAEDKNLPPAGPEAEIAKIKEELASNKQRLEDSDNDGDKSTPAAILEKLPTIKDKTPPNKHQRVVVTGGLVLAVAGICLWPLTSFWLGLAVATVGAIVVAGGTFVKV